jgi:hypothetical protein
MLMAGDGGTNRPFPSLVLLGIVDFCCILIGLEQVSVHKLASGAIWIAAGVGSGLIGYYWPQLKRTVASVRARFRRGPSKLVIRRAVYAAGRPTEEQDVTYQLENAVRDGIVVTVDATLGGLLPRDPAFGVHKRLDVEYSYGSDSVLHVSRTELPPGEIMRLVLPEDTEVQRLTSNQRLPIEILTPLNYGEVGFRRVVSGSVLPALSRVQVWVFAGDGFWYRQGSVKVDGCLWSVECQFGNNPVEEKPSKDFQIIAIAEANIREERLTVLPNVGIKSEIVKVRRTHNEKLATAEAKLPDSDESKARSALFSSLQIEAFTIAKDLRDFLASLPPFPRDLTQNPGEDTPEFLVRFYDVRTRDQEAWKKKLLYGYANRQFAQRITALIHHVGEEVEYFPAINPNYAEHIEPSGDGIRKLAQQMEILAIGINRKQWGEVDLLHPKL